MTTFLFAFWGLLALLLTHQSPAVPQTHHEVKIVGAMRNVMLNGQLYGTISLDTISNKDHLYGLGPVEYLTGEIVILDGKSYVSTVRSDSTMQVEETYNIKAPFFGYANIERWNTQLFPDTVYNLQHLERYLDQITQSSTRPFMFLIRGTADHAAIHVMNLPPGLNVNSPAEAHKWQTTYFLTNEEVEIVGFFSTEHQTIFTHHDTYLHMHLITADKRKMGHLEDLFLKKGTATLYLPAE